MIEVYLRCTSGNYTSENGVKNIDENQRVKHLVNNFFFIFPVMALPLNL